jgi:hypothetical protein
MKTIILDCNLDLVDKIAQMPWHYLIIASLIILPVLIGSWVLVLNQLGSAINEKGKKIFAIIFLLVYTVGIIVMKSGNENESMNKVAISEIKAELNGRGWVRIGFKRIRNNLNRPEYTDDFLIRLIPASNGLFHRVILYDDSTHDTVGIAIDSVEQKQK